MAFVSQPKNRWTTIESGGIVNSKQKDNFAKTVWSLKEKRKERLRTKLMGSRQE